MQKKTRITVLIAMLLCFTSVSFISASKVWEKTMKGKLQTGSVDIKVTQLEIDENGNLKEAVPHIVLPGQDISYIPEIETFKADSYVRLKVDLIMDNKIDNPITIDNIKSIKDGWIKKGDYFYYTKVLKKNNPKQVFQGLKVPSEWSSEKSTGFKVKVTADCIQAANFKPDFSSDMPWGSVKIEESKNYDGINYGHVEGHKKSNNILTFDRDSGLQSTTSDLFQNWGEFMAGDTYKDTLKIKNKSNNPITVYFRTKNHKIDLKDSAHLIIRLGDKIIYDGNLTSLNLNEYVKLAKIKGRDSIDLSYEIYVNKDSENTLSALTNDVEWQFKVVEDTSQGSNNGSISTGDQNQLLIYMGLFIISLVLIIIVTEKIRDEYSK